jgi:hypothetical protein
VRGFQVADTAVLGKRDLAPAEFELEFVRVAAGAHQHRLFPQRDALLVQGQNTRADLGCLPGRVEAVDKPRHNATLADRLQALRIGVRRVCPHLVGEIENRLRGAVVARQRHQRRVGEVVAEAEDVRGAGGTKTGN